MNANDSWGAAFFFCMVGMLAGVIIGLHIEPSNPLGRSSTRDALVKAGHAEYYLDADNNRQWRLKPMRTERDFVVDVPAIYEPPTEKRR